MTTSVDLERIRWALAERLEGMREGCPQAHYVRDEQGWGGAVKRAVRCDSVRCPGYVPVPLTAEGLIDDTRLLRVLVRQTLKVEYVSRTRTWRISVWGVKGKNSEGPDLAIAYLRAVGAEEY